MLTLPENQIFSILKEGESGVMIVPDLYRQYGVGQRTYYKWKSQYGGIEASDLVLTNLNGINLLLV